ncbi:MAG: hypothetical protein WC860_05175 [Candidatus Margulisiibacteriota bacterium]|jgi:hypothetical protein
MNIGSDMADIRSVPVIWPSSKKQVKETQASEESQQASRQVTSAKSSPSSAAQEASKADTAQAAQAAAKEPSPPPPSTRSMTMSDVVQYLLQAKIPNTEDNKFMASLMMQHGIELSGDNFSALFKLSKGDKNANTLEAAVINLTKGIDTSKGVDILGGFLKDNPQLQTQIVTANQALADLQRALSSTQKLLDPGLMSGLISLLSNMDEEFKKLLKAAQEGKSTIPELKRGALVKDMNLLSQLLNGVEQKLAENNQLNTPEGKELQQKLLNLKSGINSLSENLIAQIILSEDSNRNVSSLNDKFLYWQLPNPFDKNNQIELAIRKDGSKENGAVNLSKTRILLKVDTPALGEITIIIDVLDQKIWYIFNTESDEVNGFIKKMHSDLLKQMEALNYRVSGFQAIKKKIDIKKIIVPTLSLDNLVRISTEV